MISTHAPADDSTRRLGEELAALGDAQRRWRTGTALRASVAVVVVGIGLAVAAFFVSHNTADPLVQRDAIVLALVGNAVTLAGAAGFVAATLMRYLRFWMARLIHVERTRGER